MKPHINIGVIGHIDHGKTTLTAAITSTLVSEPEKKDFAIDPPLQEDEPPLPARKPRGSMAGLLAMTAMLAGCGMYGMGGGRSSAAERNDPDRPKTPQDLERLVAAQLKRERKAARKARNNATRRP
jgi:hypothetical protein